eukprot:TRINITY_DN75620_c0_g1_i2.p1 TRINITY_DN75620_c0_g1~~TRINITY_DN75620_c0_g1_i2.p1  ORF type:complete len:234 (+),score=33.89 TRINITY_DN75620_c0_g1_i2:69-704(+)
MAPKGPATYSKIGKSTEGLRARNRGSNSDSEEEDTSHLSERELAKKKWVDRLNWVWRKINAAFWVGLACLTIYWTNFFRVIWESPLVNRTYFYLALACLFFNITMLFYLAVWCVEVKGLKNPWEDHNPKAIPVMAICGFLTFFLFFFALWPVWGFLTILIQLVFFLGFVNAGQFLPGGAIGSIMMFVIFFGAFFTSVLIPHEGFAHYSPRN